MGYQSSDVSGPFPDHFAGIEGRTIVEYPTDIRPSRRPLCRPFKQCQAARSGPSLAGSHFGETRWSLVGRMGHENAEVRQGAMASILRRYLSPLRSYLIVRKRIDPHRADDLLQEFIADKVLGAGILTKAMREKGKFRTFLLVALDRFVLNQIRGENAAKRVPENGFVSLADEPAVSDDGANPGREFDMEWARTVLEDAGPDAGDVPARWPQRAVERVPATGSWGRPSRAPSLAHTPSLPSDIRSGRPRKRAMSS